MQSSDIYLAGKTTIASLLKSDFHRRKKTNPTYSLRAYARTLGISPSTLHGLISEKIYGSKKLISVIARNLHLTKDECRYFELIAKCGRARSRESKTKAVHEAMGLNTRFNSLSDEEFTIVGNWYHFAIMELLKTKGARAEVAWISKKLGIEPKQGENALSALQKLGIIELGANKTLKVLKDFVALPSGEPMTIARDFHQTIISKAQQAIETQSIRERNVSTLVLRFRKSDLPKVDLFIRNFRRAFCAEFESGEAHDAVYSLGVQFIRLDREE